MEDEEAESETSNLVWVNSLLRALWPNATAALVTFAYNDLTPRLQQGLPLPFKSAHFARFSLGDGVPSFGPIDVIRRSGSHICIELEMCYSSAVDILLAAGSHGVSLGVKQIRFHGRLCIEMKPIIDTWPIVGSFLFAFAGQPQLELEFSGIADVPLPGLPGLAKKVQGIVDGSLAHVVLPNCKSVRLTSDERFLSLAACSSKEPIGVLELQVARGINLAGANWRAAGMGPNVRSFTSNPYCIVQVGNVKARTSSVRATTNPDWNDDPFFFLVYHNDQEVLIDVMDDDGGFLQRNFVGLLGRLRITVRELLSRRSRPRRNATACPSSCRFALDTSQVKRGLLHVDDPVNTGVPSELDVIVGWLEMSPMSPKVNIERIGASERRPEGIILLELHHGTGFPEESLTEASTRLVWACSLSEDGERERVGSSCRSSAGRRSEEPNFHLPIPQCLYSAIDQLTARGVEPGEVADIVQIDRVQVEQYLSAKSRFLQDVSARQLETGEDQCVELAWHETLALLVHRPKTAHVHLRLVGEMDYVLGDAGPIRVEDVLTTGSGHLRTVCKLSAASGSLASGREHAGKLSAWMFPTCTAPTTSRSRFKSVRMEVSVRYQALTWRAESG
ncbi:esyt2-a [Symbiodinium natans]|uniref:Esyt2-a protein n=1 Tax=Symbiodinium natans TaxID=878477 RepID=A0A812JQK0_9DINO|nr:esyt2-a [Symbiodinium natans]